MIRFTVLNEDEQAKSKEEESEEIQAEKFLGVYQSAIRLVQKGQLNEARRMLKNLIESDLMQKIDNDTDMAARGTPLRLLQYLVYTNYASILEQCPDESSESVLKYYLKAVTFDSSDNALWVKIGKLAATARKYKLARYALECGLQQSNPEAGDAEAAGHVVTRLSADYDLTPSQWTCLEALCEVLYKIGDLVSCQEYVQKALRLSPYFERGLELQQLVRRRLEKIQSPVPEDQIQTDDTNIPDQKSELPKELVLDDLSWKGLGELLLEEYKVLLKAPEMSFYNRRLIVVSSGPHSEDVDMSEETDMAEVEPEEEQPEGNGDTTGKLDPESPSAEPVDIAMDALPADEAATQADRESTEADQGAALKRKRKEVEERSGLRTSKRVRDKLDQYEVTKKKREEEEQETLAKYRIVLSKFGMDLENGYYGNSSEECLQPDEIFPGGISGVISIFNKHLERPNAIVQASTMEHVQQQKTNHFAVFTDDKTPSTTEPLFESNSTLLNFVKVANEQNSGVVEYLCLYILMLMSGTPLEESKLSWKLRWPSGVRPVVSEIVTLLEDRLLEFLHKEGEEEAATFSEDQMSRLELYLSIGELYLDEMVYTVLRPFTFVSRRSRGAKKMDAEGFAKLECLFQRWLVRAGQSLQSFVADEISNSNQDPKTASASLRINWMMGRYCQSIGDAEGAIARFEYCQWIVQGDSNIQVTLPNCKYDTTVDSGTVQDRLGKLKTHQYVLDAERLFSEDDYQAVLTRLEPIFLTKESSDPTSTATVLDEAQPDANDFNTIGGSLSERIELMGLLYKSCDALKDRKKQFECISEMLVRVVTALINTTTERSEATETWFLFSQTNQLLLLMRETIQASDLAELLGSLRSNQLQKLICCVLAVARLGFVNVLHQDRLVDDDIKISYSDLLKNRPHLEQFNLVLVRSWIVLLLLLPGWVPGKLADTSSISEQDTAVKPQFVAIPLDITASDLDAETVRRVTSQPLTTNSSTPVALYPGPSTELYMELIALVHDDFGVREICGLDNNKLIELALKVSSPMEGVFYRKEENQCYYCFYGISLSVDGQYPIEHSSEPVDFDRKAATEFFPLLERSLSDRALRGQIRGDLKDAVDRVEEALGSPPYESSSILSMNRHIIDSYLASEINFAEAIQVNAISRLPTMEQAPSSKLASVYRSIYAIQGKVFLSQFRNKAKNNQFKPLEDLQHAIDQFGTDLHVNPYCWDSWYSLALCYTFLADENLVFSASDIRNNFSKIKDLQRRAFLCFSQAARLSPKRGNKVDHERSQSTFGEGEPEAEASWASASQEGEVSERPVPEDCEPKVPSGQETKTASSEDQEWRHSQAAFWFDFGNLVHGIMSKPVRMEAMHRTEGLEALSDTGDITSIYIPEPTPEQVYKFAAFCFKRSLSLNDQNWRAPFMLGKCVEKLNGKPSQVLSLYRLAVDKVPRRSGQPGNERIFEPAYKLISTLTKYLNSDKVKPSVVEAQMTKSLVRSKLSTAEGDSFIFEPPTEYLQTIESQEADEHKNGKMQAYRLLCEGLARIRHVDKRHWHHRPAFRQSWILYHIYHDVERAKAEMLSLFQMKSNLKTLVSAVWKPEFERSGKHFVYVGEYTKFLIVLAKESKDVETLNSLAKKIRRANALLLDLKEVWELLYDSYLSVLGELVGPEPALAVAEVIPRMEFREKAAIYEAKMFEQDPRPAGLTVLMRLCELKKLNDKLAPEGQMGHYLAVCYSKLFIEVGGAELYPKELLRQLSNPSEPAADTTMVVDGETSAMDVDGGSESTPVGTDSTRNSEGDGEEDDHKNMRTKMERLTTEVPMASDDSEVKAMETEENVATNVSVDINPASNTADASGVDTPAKDGETTANDGVAAIEDWKSRKKISATELASRATIIFKAPPPSLKAPQSLQSKLAGPPLEENVNSNAANNDSVPEESTVPEDGPSMDGEAESNEVAPPESTLVEGEEEATAEPGDGPAVAEDQRQQSPVRRTSSRRNSRVDE
ncbi:calcineurin-binding protein cabin-1 [Entomortierella parvispora]|uniref:Calcineurin-binding protein cabin-1 n=1 Tax=Entomortierella parvispora TaxID=205924 RepID=A0A9P3LWK8_9FUNG|nr:calcineurin-binding protein cabin-1 [Entomortierella parvispora]